MADLLLIMPVPFEPKRANRFILRFPSSMGINEWYVTSTKRPSVKINATEMAFLNTSTFVAGRYNWDPITVTFKDPIGPSASQALMEWLRLHAESVTGRMGYAVGYKRDIELDMLDPTGVTVEKWSIQGAFLTSLNFGDLDYSRDDVASITCELRMDKCIHLY
jgi:hypothetical protein